LEPAQDAAVRAVLSELKRGEGSVACPLTRRWGRTLSDEFKRGACHAGSYETSLVLAADGAVREAYRDLPEVDTSLSDGIRDGKETFLAMGMTAAYAGAPAKATRQEGEALYDRLVDMIVTEVLEGLQVVAADSGVAPP
jgi:creatinine amidohydrolase